MRSAQVAPKSKTWPLGGEQEPVQVDALGEAFTVAR